ncbi:MAG: HAMP domain-containing histidine kinase [Desulfovibrio sp.]|jgi:signal transduction histidine kinase|nr:HAMP domain-containing histidine kinase [Desulfovibrio sp.]
MRKTKPFTKLFTIYFISVNALTVAVFIVLGLGIIDHFFSYYVDKIHEETQHMLVMQVATHYKMYKTWEGYDGAETGATAKLSGDYFTITDLQEREIYSSEKGVERCCTNTNHMYTRVSLPIVVDGTKVGMLTAGYFTNHITSPEADAFRRSGVFLVVLSIVCISLAGAAVSMLFFYRLSKPIREIADAAKEISKGHLQTRIDVKSNVSEMHETADAINALSTSLLNQEKFRQRLIIELSHELRTPLQILLNQVEAVLDGIHKADTARLESMHAEIARTAELLNELEDRLMYENDAFDINIALVNISDIARNVALGYEGSFARKNLAFTCDIDVEVMAEVDSVRFAQVLINVLSNALKYTAAGRVAFSLNRKGRTVEVVVEDTGEGMDPEMTSSVLHRSAYTNDGRPRPPHNPPDRSGQGRDTSPDTSAQTFKAGGSRGVGLYITRLIVDKHGWSFTVNSQPGKGTRVVIILKQAGPV